MTQAFKPSVMAELKLSQAQWLMVGGVCLLTMNAAMYYRMSSRLDDFDRSIASMELQVKSAPASTGGATSRLSGSATYRESGLTKYDTALPPAARLAQLKQRNRANTSEAISRMDRLLKNEPTIPQVEQKQTQWLASAVQSMPKDAPEAVGLETTCRGRRCMVSAAFADEGQARVWASRYLIAAGGRLLPKSRTVIVPLGGPDQGVDMQLYLY